MTEILSSSRPKAKKVHKCSFCTGKIDVGEKYLNEAMVMDGDFYVWKSHIRCAEIASKLKMYESAGDDGLSGEVFREIIYEEYKELLRKWDRDFVFPSFQEQLDYVCLHHLKP